MDSKDNEILKSMMKLKTNNLNVIARKEKLEKFIEIELNAYLEAHIHLVPVFILFWTDDADNFTFLAITLRLFVFNFIIDFNISLSLLSIDRYY